MSTTSPIEAEAFRLLRDNLYEHLEEAEYLADAGPWSPEQAESIRTVMSALVTIIRSLMAQHDPPRAPARRYCATCNTYWPCPGIYAIYKVLKDPDGELVKLIRARQL